MNDLTRMTTLLCLVATMSACAHAYPPNERDAIMRTAPVEHIGQSSARADLMLAREGHWSLVEREMVSREDRPEPGTLISMVTNQTDRDPMDEDRHLYVVLVSREWGMHLQRLDHRPITVQVPRASAPIEVTSSLLQAHGACILEGDDWESLPCIQDAPLNTRFDLYSLDKKNRVLLEGDIRDEQYTLPATPRGFLHRDARSTHLVGERPKRALAIALPAPTRLPAKPNIVIDTSCPDALIAPGEHASITRAPLNKDALQGRHLLEIESLAMLHGADVLLQCDKERGEVHVAAPSIGREWLRSPAGFDLGPPVLGATTLTFKKLDGRTLTGIAMAMGAMARADSHTASHWIGRVLRSPTDNQLDPFVSRASQLLAHGHHPGAALRASFIATRNAWNRQEDLASTLMYATMWASLGQERERIIHEGKLSEHVERSREAPLQGWTFWRNAALEILDGSISTPAQIDAIGKDTREGEGSDLPLWKLALHAVHILQTDSRSRDEESDRVLLQRAEALNLTTLFQQILRTSPAPPVTEACPLDVYGRCIAHQELSPKEYVQQLRKTSRAPLNTGFAAANIEPEDPVLALALAMFARPTGKQKSNIFKMFGAHFIDLTSRQMLCDRSLDIEALGSDFASRDQPLEERARELEWLAMSLTPAACQGWAAALREVERVEDTRRLYGILLLEQMSAREDADDRFERLEALAALALDYSSTAQCQRINLALAMAMLESGMLERANTSALAGLNCRHEGASKHDEDANAVLAFIAYEQYGKLPGTLSRSLRARLLTQKLDPKYAWCPGLAPSAPNFKGAIAPEILNLSHGIRKEVKEDALQVMRASEAVALATNLMERGKSALYKGEWEKSAELFDEARAIAARANAPEITRPLDFIEAHLYGKSFKQYIKKEDAPATPPTKPDKPATKREREAPASTLDEHLERVRGGEAAEVRRELEAGDAGESQVILISLTLLDRDITALERVAGAKGDVGPRELCEREPEVF